MRHAPRPNYLEAYAGESDSFHPFGLMGDPFVLVDDGSFRMWFTSAYGTEHELTGIAYTESTDGIIWQDPKAEHLYELMNIMIGTDASDWDHGGLETNTVVQHPVTGQYFMYYAGIYDEEAFAIGLATSDDRIT